MFPYDDEQEPRSNSPMGAQPDAVRRSRAPIDIPLDGRGDDPAQISRLELEMVNRHHAEVKALYRRAQKGE